MSDWSLFRGNKEQTGYSADKGPSDGTIQWKTHLGRQWYSPPILADGRLYQACPARNGTKLLCLDARTGETIWAASGMDATPGTVPARTRFTSTLIDLGDSLLLRGTKSDAVFRVSKNDGSVVDTFTGFGFADYRIHPVPLLSGDQDHFFALCGASGGGNLITPQPTGKPWNWLICADTRSGDRKWMFRTGQYFGKVATEGNRAYIGTLEGFLLCLRIHDNSSGTLKNDAEWEQNSVRRIEWSFKVPAPINGSPAAVEGQVFFGANDGGVYCLDARTGRLIWRHSTGPANPRSFIHFSEPLILDKHVFIGDSNNKLHKLDRRTGEQIDRIEFPDWLRARPAAAKDRLIAVGIDGSIVCIASEGSDSGILWRSRLEGGQFTCDPVVDDSRAYIVGGDLALRCVSMDTGKQLWTKYLVDYPNDWVAFDEFQSSPQVARHRIFVGTPGRFVYAIDQKNGNSLWRFETGGEVPGDPICVSGRVYIGQQGGNGDYYCLDAKNGAIIWKQRLGWVWSAANYFRSRLYVPGVDGNAYCLDAITGRIIWRYAAESDLYAAPAISGGLVFFGSWDHWLYALSLETGEPAWKFHAGTYLDSGAPAVADGRLFLPTMGPHFYCLEANTGKEFWHFAPDRIWSTNTSPAVCGDRVVMMAFMERGTRAHPYEIRTYCLDAATGAVVWSYPAGGLNGPVIADGKVYFASTERGKPYFYCLDLTGRGDGTTDLLWRRELGFTVLESCTAVAGRNAYVYAEDGNLHAFT